LRFSQTDTNCNNMFLKHCFSYFSKYVPAHSFAYDVD